jgi:hypothetical protein
MRPSIWRGERRLQNLLKISIFKDIGRLARELTLRRFFPRLHGNADTNASL